MKIEQEPILIGAGALFPYSDALYEDCSRVDRFDEPYNLSRVLGAGDHRRIMVPRNLASGGKDITSPGMKYAFKCNFEPRNDEQERFVKETTILLKGGNSFVAEAPTGFGKTACATQIITNVGLKTLVVVTKEDLRDQWKKAAKTFLGLNTPKTLGIIQGDVCQVAGRGLVIALVQSLAKEDRYDEVLFRQFGLVIWDETHRMGADFFSQSAFRIPAKLRLGISATPDRKDGRSEVIRAHIGPTRVVAVGLPMVPKVIAKRSVWKIPMVRVYDPVTGKPGIGPLPHSAGKCGHVINLLCKNHGRNMQLVTFIAAAYKKGRNILVQSDRKEHLEELVTLCSSKGVPPGDTAYYVGGMKEAAIKLAKDKRVIFSTYQMTSEGTDIPWMDVCVMATPKSDIRQIAGRILREWEGKPTPIIFDLIDDSSYVFGGYWNSRELFYRKIGAAVEMM